MGGNRGSTDTEMYFRKQHQRAGISSNLEMISVRSANGLHRGGRKPVPSGWGSTGPKNSQQGKEEILVLNEAEQLLPAAMRQGLMSVLKT